MGAAPPGSAPRTFKCPAPGSLVVLAPILLATLNPLRGLTNGQRLPAIASKAEAYASTHQAARLT